MLSLDYEGFCICSPQHDYRPPSGLSVWRGFNIVFQFTQTAVETGQESMAERGCSQWSSASILWNEGGEVSSSCSL